MSLPALEYVRPDTLDAASAILDADADAQILAGGQSLLPTLKQRLARPSVLVDLQAIPELHGVRLDADSVTLGAMTRHAEVATDAGIRAAIPALAWLAGGIAHPQVRHLGTIGGSVANNDPAADYPAAVVGLGARIRTTRREIAADDFFTGLFSTALEPGEIIVSITFPRPRRAGYHKFSNIASGYVTTGAFVSDGAQGVRVAVNGAGPCVFRHAQAEALLASDFSLEALEPVTQDAQNLNSDLHASAAWRAQLTCVAIRRATAMALEPRLSETETTR